MKQIAIIGVGLIGGSFALDIKNAYPETEIIGLDNRKDHLEEAVKIGLIKRAGSYDDLMNSDVVILAIPVDAAVEQLPKILDVVGDDTLVMDVGSTKTNICKVADDHPKRRNYLATHPISGTEFSGPSAAIHNLYRGKTNIICEVEKTAFKLQEKGLEIFRAIGMRIRYMNPEAHDKHIAYVSHLSHISAFMLGKTVIDKEKNERDIFDMAGSGFASTVRLAKSSPEMWTPIFRENRENVLETLEEYIANLTQFKELMQNNEFEKVFDEMKNTNHIKAILNGIV